MTTAPILHIDHLQKSFGKFQALRDVTFDVYPGEVFGFIGPNGAGKSTTIRTILGILRASGGQATLFGQDVFKESVSIHKRIAYVPGDVYLWPNLTGGEIIDLFLKLGGSKHSAKTDEMIKRFQLDPTKKARTYSKGNRQKVALIAAFSTDADFYIFDEPTSGLDPLNEEYFQKSVAELKAAGKAVLLSSHILSEVEKMCDRIGIIRNGEIVETGTLAEMRHLTRTVIEFQTDEPTAELSGMKGVHNVVKSDNGVQTFSVDSDQIGQVMDYLASKKIITLQSTPPTLEDLFMRYYNTNGSVGGEKDVQQ
ncbi:ABC transporter ATP-binding protein [Companilactobacillus sp.]|jgi:ABC-2 type transport system ATP-binding protein|uniref:ABC transporter ATP-binding protein n=1 Tax=Companilactobacillus sp. TaxID=2767905 RepID=UPI0025C5B720|nr:ABC transporter ATP-binding protein [Companilactobacillus sp.]MCH4009070.1 ABC transporter ATP-binding protein [Companilactobacillus sp.]MCH4050751.1 ABC transporter ATP-binding protein [Companilactobacillus sp.]MCH4077012.1 ABC transporter ATP-binding protein [Companilactobacillus sp.]MCH4125588.1 ABC transporter ATP-binding protein [Companilactobacillus sp.]MCI1311297.1 ABC transporter ATP-binding protein [Companilactobacillus sp.]